MTEDEILQHNPELIKLSFSVLSQVLQEKFNLSFDQNKTWIEMGLSDDLDQIEFIMELEKELNIVKDYLALEYIRFADRLVVEYAIDDNTLQNQMPPMMLQTLVENAIKHGLSKQPGNCLIKIISTFEDNKHLLMVQNTGVLDQEVGRDGFGLQSTKNRLNILYRGNALFEIYQSQPSQVTAKLIIPIAS